MPPDSGGLGTCRRLPDALQERRDVLWRANVLDGKGQKLFPGISVMPNGGSIYVEDRETVGVVYPNGNRITVKKQVIPFLCVFQFPLRVSPLGDFALDDESRESEQEK